MLQLLGDDVTTMDFLERLSRSDELERAGKSFAAELIAHLNNPDSALGLAGMAIINQLKNTGSVVYEEANFSFSERQLVSMALKQFLKGAGIK